MLDWRLWRRGFWPFCCSFACLGLFGFRYDGFPFLIHSPISPTSVTALFTSCLGGAYFVLRDLGWADCFFEVSSFALAPVIFLY